MSVANSNVPVGECCRYPMCSMYGIFTYKTGSFMGQMLVNIAAPWSIWVWVWGEIKELWWFSLEFHSLIFWVPLIFDQFWPQTSSNNSVSINIVQCYQLDHQHISYSEQTWRCSTLALSLKDLHVLLVFRHNPNKHVCHLKLYRSIPSVQ